MNCSTENYVDFEASPLGEAISGLSHAENPGNTRESSP